MATLAELLYANSTWGSCTSQIFWRSLTTIAIRLGHRVIHTLHPAIAIPVVGAGRNFQSPQKLVDHLRKLSANLEDDVREYSAQASPDGDVPVDKIVGRVRGCKFCSSDRLHVGSAAETISEGQYVGVTSGRDRKDGEVIDSNGNATAFGQGHRDDGPPDRQP